MTVTLRQIALAALVLLIPSLLFSSALGWAEEERSVEGFLPEDGRTQLALEERFRDAVNPENLKEWMEFLSSKPHHVGSPFGRKAAEFVADKFREWGYETEIESFQILFPTPKTRIVTLLEPERYEAKLQEPALTEDRTTDQIEQQLPTFHFYSRDGDVTGEAVYVNYGIPEDYEDLDRLGISVEGKVVIARYGASWRGIKPKLAAEKGAIGCIIYSDPRDDGYFQGDVYPKGPFRNGEGVQRGSVMDMPLYPGDPLTPFKPALPDAERLPREEVPTITAIPVLPISYDDALPILRSLEGPVAPENWRGALPITYHVGPGPARVRLKVESDWGLVPAYDVIARLQGSELPDEWVIRGNHHDAWVNGAEDPVSGLVALMEEARAVSELAKSGWRPRRTIVYAAWDAEEPGLIGSTEWVEAHQQELLDKAVVYINSDGNGRGFLSASGSHVLETVVNSVASRVVDPQKGVSVLERRLARDAVNASFEEQEKALDTKSIHLGALGSGSDYTPFIQHLGITAVNLGFGGESEGGSYHSIYDSFDHYLRFGDPGFQYGKALAELAGRITLRMANADLLPWNFNDMAETVGRYSEELIQLADTTRRKTERHNELLERGYYQDSFDPTLPFVLPAEKPSVPFLNFAPLRNAVARLVKAGSAYQAAAAACLSSEAGSSRNSLEEVNRILYRSERSLTLEKGLKGRPWFRHQVYAPGFYTGYGVKTLPGVRESIEQRDWEEADRQIGIAAEVLDAYTSQIERATRELVR
jgi:N-acetylated-alpha-linked acidic dipeptidase